MSTPHPLMEYISTQKASSGASKYYGEVAAGYDAKREQSPKWQVEQAIIEDMLKELADGDWVLDVPCGTGRFFDYYASRKFCVRGVDRSPDMLKLAKDKLEAGGYDDVRFNLGLGNACDLRSPVVELEGVGPVADVEHTDGTRFAVMQVPDNSVDAALMVRLTRWLDDDERIAALKEMQRVARQKIIFTARVRNHKFAFPYEAIESALDGWHIGRDEAGHEEDYRIIELRPA